MQLLTPFLISVALVLVCQFSYVHPDEHFQSLEILIGKIYNLGITTPWEFNEQNAARSYVPLYLFYGPLIYCAKILHINNPIALLMGARIQNFFFYITLFYKICSNQESRFIMLTSFITYAFQSHTFSNSIETLILLSVIYLFSYILQNNNKTNIMKLSLKVQFELGFLISLGIFNRITFPAFILLPSIFMFYKFYYKNILSFISLVISVIIVSIVFIAVDTKIFNAGKIVFAPWNNFAYNIESANLKLHGIHPRITHLLINLPQILGLLLPVAPAMLFNSLNSDLKHPFKNILNLSALSIISSIIILSIFQHQELRFLTPVLPLFAISFQSLQKITPSTKNNNNGKAVYIFQISKGLVLIWLIFNIGMTILYGMLHQSGIITFMNYYHSNNSQKLNELNTHIWWKTYSPPTWMYMSNKLVSSTTSIGSDNVETVNNIDFNNILNNVIDLKGCDVELLNITLSNVLDNNGNITLILPASVKSKLQVLNGTYLFNEKYFTNWHLDLDHIDFEDVSSLYPGLYAFDVQRKDDELN